MDALSPLILIFLGYTCFLLPGLAVLSSAGEGAAEGGEGAAKDGEGVEALVRGPA
jgi:hypothetical protein